MPLEKQLADALTEEEALSNQLESCRSRVRFLRRRAAVVELQREILLDVTAQECVSRLDAALSAFVASLTAPADFDKEEQGDYEDTDDFADARVIDRAVDVEIVRAMGRLDESDTNPIDGVAATVKHLICISHFIARGSEAIDDRSSSVGDAARDVMDDLRQDVSEAWYEVADRLHTLIRDDGAVARATLLLQASLGVLHDDCGGYFADAAAALGDVGSAGYVSRSQQE